MKTIQLLSLAVVLSAATIASAITAPDLPAGPTFFEMTDHSNGASYRATEPGTYTWDPQTQSYVGPGVLEKIAPPGGIGDEDTWGVFGIKTLRTGSPIENVLGEVTGMGVNPFGDITYEWTSGAEVGVVGIFYGGKDVEITVEADGTFTVVSEDVKFDLWAVDTDKLFYDTAQTVNVNHEGPEYDAARRTGINEYAGWIDATDATKIPLAHGVSEYFVFSLETGLFPTGNFEGGTTAYFDIAGDDTFWKWNAAMNQNIMTDPNGDDADVWMDMEIVNENAFYSWLAKSNDDGGFATPIPEPMTMGALGMAIAGLGGYVRRRRR